MFEQFLPVHLTADCMFSVDLLSCVNSVDVLEVVQMLVGLSVHQGRMSA